MTLILTAYNFDFLQQQCNSVQYFYTCTSNAFYHTKNKQKAVGKLRLLSFKYFNPSKVSNIYSTVKWSVKFPLLHITSHKVYVIRLKVSH
jgi:hypothetical protein